MRPHLDDLERVTAALNPIAGPPLRNAETNVVEPDPVLGDELERWHVFAPSWGRAGKTEPTEGAPTGLLRPMADIRVVLTYYDGMTLARYCTRLYGDIRSNGSDSIEIGLPSARGSV